MRVVWDWGKGGVATVHSVEELDSVLDRVDEDARASSLPTLVDIVGPEREHLTIGLGLDSSILLFDWSDVQRPGYRSLGDVDDDGDVHFMYGGSYTEFSTMSAIPATIAREAARLFFRDPGLPSNVEWEERSPGATIA